jgi:hypothetical protein
MNNAERRNRATMLAKAIEDAYYRIGTNHTDKSYVRQQRNKIKKWTIEMNGLIMELQHGEQGRKSGVG